MIAPSRYLQAWVYNILLVAGLILSGLGLAYPWAVVATMRHERAALRQEICSARLRALKAANPIARILVMPADPCLAIQIVYERSH